MKDAAELPGWTHVYSGKVRDLYVPTSALDDDDSWTGDPLHLSRVVLVVASDRVSAYDVVLEPAIPGKGAMLTALTRWWFDQLPEVPNHLAYAEDDRLDVPAIPDAVADRATLCRTLDMFPIECVVRGFITGGGWNEYQATGAIGGVPLPEGLQNGDRLPEPIYTPAWKAPMGEHDENISYERTVELVGETEAEQLRALSLEIFALASTIAEERGLILADTKFEFGADRDIGHRDPRRRGAHERLEPLLGCRGLPHGRDARAAHGELRQADRARLARRELGPGRVRGAADAPPRDRRAHRRALPRAARSADRRRLTFRAAGVSIPAASVRRPCDGATPAPEEDGCRNTCSSQTPWSIPPRSPGS